MCARLLKEQKVLLTSETSLRPGLGFFVELEQSALLQMLLILQASLHSTHIAHLALVCY